MIPGGKAAWGYLLMFGVSGEFSFCLSNRDLRELLKQTQFCSPYQTFSFLLPIPPQNRDPHLHALFADVTAELYLGS